MGLYSKLTSQTNTSCVFCTDINHIHNFTYSILFVPLLLTLDWATIENYINTPVQNVQIEVEQIRV